MIKENLNIYGEINPVNILLAEDDKNFGIIIKSELEEVGYVVDLVNDGVEAVLRFIDGHYNVFLFDIQMPRLWGAPAPEVMTLMKRSSSGCSSASTQRSEV